MKVTHIDLYQLHYPNYAVAIGETMVAMEELVNMGKVRFIGVSNFSVADLKRARLQPSSPTVSTTSEGKIGKIRGHSDPGGGGNWQNRSSGGAELVHLERGIAIPKADSIAHAIENCNASGWRLSPEQARVLEENIKIARTYGSCPSASGTLPPQSVFFWN